MASIVSNDGGKPASSGRSCKSEPAKLCSVWILALSSCSTPCLHRFRLSSLSEAFSAALSSSVRMRSRSSAAAASVKVMAATLSSVVAPLPTSSRMRFTRLVVLPVPAPASTNSVSLSACSMVLRASLSWGLNSLTVHSVK